MASEAQRFGTHIFGQRCVRVTDKRRQITVAEQRGNFALCV